MEVTIQKTDLISAVIISKSLSKRNYEQQVGFLVRHFEKKKYFISHEDVIKFWTEKMSENLFDSKDELCEGVSKNPSFQEVKINLSEDVIEILHWLKLC